ncbi:hypothetical protein BN1723_017179, partial [Verticillium longisporum]
MEAPKRATKFAANDEWGKIYRKAFGAEKMNQSLSILTGASAGATEAIVVVPFELIKIRMQDKASAGKYTGMLDCVAKTVRAEGILALYNGLESTIILDAPGHKTYVPSMIGGASQADVGILVISARKGEYETGFERGGQTREHAMLAKTQGVNKLVVVINKMDDPTVEWSHERYIECTTKLAQFLKGTGYNLKTDVMFMPIAAQQTMGIKTRVPKEKAPWYDGPSLLEYLDGMKTLERKLKAPFMMPVAAKYKDMGTIIEGKIEAGVVKKGMSLVMMPNRQTVEATAVYGETEDEVNISQCGDQVRLRLRGAEEEDIMPGFVLCSPKRLVHNVTAFEAQIRILELKSILSAGFNCVLHVHAAIEEVTFAALLHKLQKGTNRKSKLPPSHAKKGDSIIARMEVTGGAGSVCVERFEDYPQMGRFTL